LLFGPKLPVALAVSFTREAGTAQAPILLPPVLHAIAFAVVTVHVIIDPECPRLGLIQVSDCEQVHVDLRRSMN
jgi:hypothetical protein